MVLTYGEVSDFLNAETIAQEKSGIPQILAPSFKHGSTVHKQRFPKTSNNYMLSRIFSSTKYMNMFCASVCKRFHVPVSMK